MTIEAWTIILNSAILGLLIAYGIWLRHIVKQQVNAKDATIETLNAAVKAHEGEIARLKGETAPAIVEAYQKMRAHADLMTKDAEKLETQVKRLGAEQNRTVQTAHINRLIAESDSLRFASGQIATALEPYLSTPSGLFEPDVLRDLVISVIQAVRKIGSESQAKSAEATELVKQLRSGQ